MTYSEYTTTHFFQLLGTRVDPALRTIFICVFPKNQFVAVQDPRVDSHYRILGQVHITDRHTSARDVAFED